jgi:hypothetical protein
VGPFFVQTYTGQLRALEDRWRQDPKAAAPRLVRAYYYLVAGHKAESLAQLKAVVTLEPGDRVARRMVETLDAGPAVASGGTGSTAAPPSADRSGPPRSAGNPTRAVLTGATTDLGGRWHGRRDGSVFDLDLDEAGHCRWKSMRDGPEPIAASGAYRLSGQTLILQSPERGTLRAILAPTGADGFTFKAVGDPPGDPGLRFRRAG